jgi:hypothetical protein
MRKFHFEPFQAIKNKLRTPTAHVDMEETAYEQSLSPEDEQDETPKQL